MSPTRQDAWTQDEDLLLAEVVLRHIRDGGTQLQAFEEVGRKLSRTSAACGFRWNSYVRKQYKTGIELAKKQRKDAKRTTPSENPVAASVTVDVQVQAQPEMNTENGDINFQDVLHFLSRLNERAEASFNMEDDKERNTEKIKDLEKKAFYLAAENEKLAKNLKAIEEDYRSLIEIMDRARKMVVHQEEDRQKKVKFQMDKNGNLERIE
ncbi:RsfA family transcriptional regulator [Neobacillus sp. PS3-34]|uniref:RsfA family transcriptional regulator n=1 Tax=Neobacillus sp. PS3-34 TaxID=3070678 RepID=UPI0027E0205C|nr:RsfA family transcriptional regulator [Neobacillus sp. PS3-34]WML49355.1 RsfA family transcriptional regulator [Neobacillus sp. PS3-34]